MLPIGRLPGNGCSVTSMYIDWHSASVSIEFGDERQPSDDVEWRLVLGPLDAGILDPVGRLVRLPVRRHPIGVEQLQAEVEHGHLAVLRQVTRQFVAQHVLPLPDGLARIGRAPGSRSTSRHPCHHA